MQFDDKIIMNEKNQTLVNMHTFLVVYKHTKPEKYIKKNNNNIKVLESVNKKAGLQCRFHLGDWCSLIYIK